MMKSVVIDVPLLTKIKFWTYSCYVAAIVCFKNVIFSFWRKPVETVYPDKPPASLVGNGLGNHSYIKVNGVKFHYLENGEKGNPMVLLLHGFPDCWFGWRHQIKALGKYFRVVAVDLKGFGDSEKPQWRRQYSVPILVQEIHEFVQALGEKKCFLIGHDLGASLGWYLTAQYPSTFSKFVAIACPHPNVHWNNLSKPDTKLLHLCQIPQIFESEVRKDNLAMIQKYYKHLVQSGETEIISAYKYVFSRTEDVTGPINYLRNFPLVRLSGKKISVPTFLIVGNKDPSIAVESIVRSTEYLEDFQLKLIEGTGHFPHQEDYNQVNQLLLGYLLDSNETTPDEKINKGLLESLVTHTFKYGNSIVDNVKKTTNGVVWRPQILKSSG